MSLLEDLEENFQSLLEDPLEEYLKSQLEGLLEDWDNSELEKKYECKLKDHFRGHLEENLGRTS